MHTPIVSHSNEKLNSKHALILAALARAGWLVSAGKCKGRTCRLIIRRLDRQGAR